MKPIQLSIIIVNWNSVDYVMACIKSIREQTSHIHYELIVVDNASYDICDKRLAQQFPEVILVQSHSNLGFARANNLGAQHARGALLLFLNPDTEVLDRAIDRVYENFLSLSNPGAVGCRLLNTDGSLQTSCVQSLPTILNQILDAEVLRQRFPKSCLWGTAALFENGSTPAEVEAVSGACLLIPRAVFDLVGGFSSDYFMYGEDLDLCHKTRQAGFRNYHIGNAVIVHHGGGSSKRAPSSFSIVMMRDSVRRFLRKSRGQLYGIAYQLTQAGTAVARLTLLGICSPLFLLRSEAGQGSAPIRKWIAILRWGLGLEDWTRRYNGHPATLYPKKQVKPCAGSAVN